jgi:hypothetical protein
MWRNVGEEHLFLTDEIRQKLLTVMYKLVEYSRKQPTWITEDVCRIL